jgi:hypothetical protein
MDDPVETSASVTAWPKGISAITLFVEELSVSKTVLPGGFWPAGVL